MIEFSRFADISRVGSFSYKAEAIYDYIPDTDTFILGSRGSTTFAQFKAAVTEEIGSSGTDTWRAVKLNDSWYLMRILQNGRQYLGAFVRISDLIGEHQNKEDDTNFYCLVDQNRRIVGDDPDENVLDEAQFDQPYSIETLGETKCLVVHKKLEQCNYDLANITPYSAISQVTTTLKISLVIIAFLILVIWGVLFAAVQRGILEPITTITNALQEVAAGNLEQRIPVHNQSPEFQSIAKTYNIMVSEIKDLKINVYEQQIAHEKLESQYLKQQITPHFMINCLNTACQLTGCGELELARQLLKELSAHLRYVLSSGKTVRLSEEIKLVQNYIELSNIRYPESIHAEIQCPEELRNCAVVPLMLLNFVENAIKHEVVVGERLEIHIEIMEESRMEKKGICAVIWDTGNGYEEKVLEEIQKLTDIPVEKTPTAHIGITNVMQRTKKEFPGAEFTYSNREDAGALVRIWIPQIPYVGQNMTWQIR